MAANFAASKRFLALRQSMKTPVQLQHPNAHARMQSGQIKCGPCAWLLIADYVPLQLAY